MNAEIAGSSPVGPPKPSWDLGMWIWDFGFLESIQIRDPQSQIPNPTGPWQKGVCTSLSTKTMTVRVRSVPPNLFWILDFEFWIDGTTQILSFDPKSKIQNESASTNFRKENNTMSALKSRNILAT